MSNMKMYFAQSKSGWTAYVDVDADTVGELLASVAWIDRKTGTRCATTADILNVLAEQIDGTEPAVEVKTHLDLRSNETVSTMSFEKFCILMDMLLSLPSIPNFPVIDSCEGCITVGVDLRVDTIEGSIYNDKTEEHGEKLRDFAYAANEILTEFLVDYDASEYQMGRWQDILAAAGFGAMNNEQEVE